MIDRIAMRECNDAAARKLGHARCQDSLQVYADQAPTAVIGFNSVVVAKLRIKDGELAVDTLTMWNCSIDLHGCPANHLIN